MPSYKLTYFPIQGLAEPIRFILAYAGIEYEDYRFDKNDWATVVKPTTPFGQVPMLEIDGKKVNQSVAIARYLAKQHKLAGKDDWEALEIDVTVENIRDLTTKVGAYHYETNSESKAAKLEIAKEVVPFMLERLDAQVKKNGGYFVGGALSWADLSFVAQLNYINYMWKSNIVEKYDNLKALIDKVLNLPAIKKWVETRPETEF